MGGYVLLSESGAAGVPSGGLDLAAALSAAGWRAVAMSEGLSLFTRGPRPVSWRRYGDGLIIGDVFEVPKVGREAAVAQAGGGVERLLQTAFGRYVYATPAGRSGPAQVLRDPSGGLGCLTWRWGEVDVVADQLHPELVRVCGSAFAIDWDAVSGHVADASTLLTRCGLFGVRPVAPGAVRALEPSARGLQVWRPARIAKDSIDTPAAAGAALVVALDRAMEGLSSGGEPVMAEVSGGLDSSVVAARLNAAGADVRAWLNIATEDVRGDERLYARALCDHLGVPLTETVQPALVLTPEDVAVSQTGAFPSLNGMDHAFEAQVIAVADRTGASRVFTGLGGDSVFFAFPTPLILRDAKLRAGPGVLFTPLLEQVARWTRTSVWTLAKTALRSGPRAGYVTPASPWIVQPSAGERHPWLEDVEALPPGKAFQIESIAHTQAALGLCRRARILDLVHPLLSQPVLEACLRIPVDLLVEGGRDRGLARRVFASDLPPMIVERRSKGDVALRFGAALVEGLPAIRDYLLDGRLAAVGIIDRARLDATLDASLLPYGNEALNILRAVAVEGWVRHWEGALGAAGRAGAERGT